MEPNSEKRVIHVSSSSSEDKNKHIHHKIGPQKRNRSARIRKTLKQGILAKL